MILFITGIYLCFEGYWLCGIICILSCLDDYKPYTLANLQLTTVEKNVDRYYQDAKRGINTKTAKAVLQFDLSDKFIQEFHSLSAAARSVQGIPSNINQAINGTHTQAYGYRWKTKDA